MSIDCSSNEASPILVHAQRRRPVLRSGPFRRVSPSVDRRFAISSAPETTIGATRNGTSFRNTTVRRAWTMWSRALTVNIILSSAYTQHAQNNTK